MKLTLGFSPCPNDTFIFDAMIHHKIDTEGIDFEVVMEDVEALNQAAFQQQLDITKLSYHAFAYVTEAYQLLHSGSALGNNCGPLLIVKQKEPNWEDNINDYLVAIPGKYTTANLLLSYAFPDLKHKKELIFHDIEKAVVENRVAAGVIIHENRFTYQEKGLEKLIDLGEYWEKTSNFPIPLGGIATRRNFDNALKIKINRILKNSIKYAFEHRESVMPFVKLHAQEMSEVVMKKHIELYVNDYTLDLGKKGRAAVQYLFDYATAKNIIPRTKNILFIELVEKKQSVLSFKTII